MVNEPTQRHQVPMDICPIASLCNPWKSELKKHKSKLDKNETSQGFVEKWRHTTFDVCWSIPSPAIALFITTIKAANQKWKRAMSHVTSDYIMKLSLFIIWSLNHWSPRSPKTVTSFMDDPFRLMMVDYYHDTHFQYIECKNINKFKPYFFVQVFSYSRDWHFFAVGWQNPIHVWFPLIYPCFHFFLTWNWSSKEFIDRVLRLNHHHFQN